MKNIIFSIISTLIFLTLTASAQTASVQIMSGKIFAAGAGAASENSEFNAATFNSQGIMLNRIDQSRWSGVCEAFDCKPGATFTDSSGYGLYLEDSYRNANLTINGTTYQGFYNYGAINISRSTFQIPRFARRKGRMFFSAPFTMSGRIHICQVSEINTSCPPDKLLLDENITGHGTLRITMKVKSGYTNRVITYLTPESFEYKFEQ